MKNRIAKEALNYIPIGIALVFVCLATIHRLDIGSPAYTQSPLIPIVLFGALALLVMIVGLLLALVVVLVKRDWRQLKYTIINFIGVTLLTWIGVVIDAPTIIYMT